MPDRHYIALIHKDAGSAYGVSFPDLPGIVAAADSLDDAVAEAGEALGFALEDWSGPMPAPRTLEQLRGDAAFLAESRDAVVVAVALPDLAAAQ